MQKLSPKRKFQPFEAEPDVKAHVYQQLSALEKYAVPASSMVVVMRKSRPTAKGNQTFAVDLVVKLNEGRLEASGRARNVFEAVNRATVQMEAQLSAVQNAQVNSRERNILIQAALQNGSNTIH